VNSNSFKVPAAWSFFLQNVPTTNIPPPSVLAVFAKMYYSAITGYRSALRQHHKITTAWNRFAVDSEGDSVPPAIVNTLKGPTFVFQKDLSTSGEERTAEARETFTSALKVMRKAAVDYIRACHIQSVEASQALIDAESKGMRLSVDLQSYASQVIKDAGHADSNLWNAYINAVVSALGAELSSIRFDVAALVLAEGREKAAKQAALNTATADSDAETMDNAQLIKSIIKEHVESAGMSHIFLTFYPYPLRPYTLVVSKRLDKQVEEPKKKKQKKNKKNLEPSSSNAPNASASSSKEAASKKKESEKEKERRRRLRRREKEKAKSKKSKPT
jgi:hypothetical protein